MSDFHIFTIKSPELKFLLTIFFAIVSIVSHGQEIYANPAAWPPDKFSSNNIKKVEAVRYEVRKNGKLKSKPQLLCRYMYDTFNNRIHGVYTVFGQRIHGSPTTSLYDFSNVYDDERRLILVMKTLFVDGSAKEKTVEEKTINRFQTNIDYDHSGNRVNETDLNVSITYDISKRDTISKHTVITPTIHEYVYDNGRLIARFHHRDSTSSRYISGGKMSGLKKNCLYCEPKYKSMDWLYDHNGNKVMLNRYTKDGLLHTRHHYFYDHEGRISKEVDSTGWYVSGKGHLRKSIVYDYKAGGKTLTAQNYDSEGGSLHRTEVTYDQDDRIISEFLFDKGSTLGTTFNYDGAKLVRKTQNYGSQKIETEYLYNSNGLIREENMFINGKLKEVVKFQYE